MCVSLSLGEKKLSDSTLLGPLGVGTRRFNGVLFFLSLSPSLVLRTAAIIIIIIVEVVSRSCWIHRPFSMWIDLDRCSSPRHAVDDALERESEKKKREVVSSCPRRKEKKEKNQKSPSPPLFFFGFFGGGERRRRREVSLIFFCFAAKKK